MKKNFPQIKIFTQFLKNYLNSDKNNSFWKKKIFSQKFFFHISKFIQNFQLFSQSWTKILKILKIQKKISKA